MFWGGGGRGASRPKHAFEGGDGRGRAWKKVKVYGDNEH